jgi:hypothetical protein
VRHPHGSAAHASDFTPLGAATILGAIEWHDIDGLWLQELPSIETMMGIPAAGEREMRVLPQPTHRLQVVVPLERFFKPVRMGVGEATSGFDGGLQFPGLIGVQHDVGVVSKRLAHGFNSRGRFILELLPGHDESHISY